MANDLTQKISGTRALFALVGAAILLYVGFSLFGGPDEAAFKPVAQVDYSRPVFTTEGGVICPLERAFDQRVGHSLRDATDAAMQTFGRTEALRQVGCEVVHDGVPVQVKAPESHDQGWLHSQSGALYYWRVNLRN